MDNKGVHLEDQSYFSIEIKNILFKADLTKKIVTKQAFSYLQIVLKSQISTNCKKLQMKWLNYLLKINNKRVYLET